MWDSQMVCFLACFGFKAKKKRRKSRNTNSSVELNHGSYLPLDSDVFTKLESTEKLPEIKEKPKEASRLKIKKRVSFNLNVEAYEPIQNEELINTCLSESEEEEETKWEFNSETTSLMATLHYAEDSISSRIKSYPQNHRYHNCSADEIYEDEDDNDEYELENDLSCHDIDDSDEGKRENHDGEDDAKNGIFAQVLGSKNDKMEGFHANDRRKYVLAVLSNVENLIQWKANKVVAPLRHEKENFVLEQYGKNTLNRHPKKEQSFESCTSKNTRRSSNVFGDQGNGVAVDSSLSNWLNLT